MRKLAAFSLSFALAAALWQCFAPGSVPLVPLVIAAALLGLGFALSTGDRRLRLAIMAWGVLAGGLWCAWFDYTVVVPAIELDGELETVTVRLTDFPRTEYGDAEVTGRLIREGRDIPIYLRLTDDGEGLAPGDEIVVTASLYRADMSQGERTWDNTGRGVFLLGYVHGQYTVSAVGQWQNHIPQYISRGVKEKVDDLFPEDTRGFMRAILTGDKRGLDQPVYENLRDSGVAHIVAVSGMHVSFLVSLLAILLGRSRRSTLVLMPVILLFIAMTGMTPSVVRAGIMQILVLAAPLFRRESDGPTSLGAALLVILLANPHSIADVSLQLSFASVVGLMTVTPRVQRVLSARVDAKWHPIVKGPVRFVHASVSASLGAILFTVPLSAFHFGTVSLYAPLTNLLVVWAAGVVFAGGVAACLLGFALPWAGALAAQLVSWPVRYILWVAGTIAELPLAVLHTASGYICIWLVGVYGMAAVYLLWPGEKPGGMLGLRLGGGLLALCLLLGNLEAASSGLWVTALDVGQGQSVVLSSPEMTVVVDCGGGRYGSAGSTAAQYLFSRHIDRIDILVITHFDANHVNGVERLMRSLPVGILAVPDALDGEKHYREQILAQAEAQGVEIRTVKTNTTWQYPSGALHVFAPMGKAGDNERGLTVLMSQGEFDVLVTGDMSADIERRLVQLVDLPDIEVLVAGHHGSRYSTSYDLLEAVLPEVALISVGENNSYGHPTDEAMARLSAYGTAIYRTDLSGHITVSWGQ